MSKYRIGVIMPTEGTAIMFASGLVQKNGEQILKASKAKRMLETDHRQYFIFDAAAVSQEPVKGIRLDEVYCLESVANKHATIIDSIFRPMVRKPENFHVLGTKPIDPDIDNTATAALATEVIENTLADN